MTSWLCCCCSRGSPEEQADAQALVRFSNIKGPSCNAANFSISGKGTAYANAPLLQTRSYFDITIQEKGEFCLGVARKSKEGLDKQLNQRDASWYLWSGEGGGEYKVGDVIGCSYDLSQVRSVLEFYVNGRKIESATKIDVRGDVYPVVSVSGGSLLLVNFGQRSWKFPPPPLFESVIFSRDML